MPRVTPITLPAPSLLCPLPGKTQVETSPCKGGCLGGMDTPYPGGTHVSQHEEKEDTSLKQLVPVTSAVRSCDSHCPAFPCDGTTVCLAARHRLFDHRLPRVRGGIIVRAGSSDPDSRASPRNQGTSPFQCRTRPGITPRHPPLSSPATFPSTQERADLILAKAKDSATC